MPIFRDFFTLSESFLLLKSSQCVLQSTRKDNTIPILHCTHPFRSTNPNKLLRSSQDLNLGPLNSSQLLQSYGIGAEDMIFIDVIQFPTGSLVGLHSADSVPKYYVAGPTEVFQQPYIVHMLHMYETYIVHVPKLSHAHYTHYAIPNQLIHVHVPTALQTL